MTIDGQLQEIIVGAGCSRPGPQWQEISKRNCLLSGRGAGAGDIDAPGGM
jgi:hypothetical protein